MKAEKSYVFSFLFIQIQELSKEDIIKLYKSETFENSSVST